MRLACWLLAPAIILGMIPRAEAQQSALTLACKGTTTSDEKSEPISMGIIVNFTTRTVQGFGYPGLLDYPVKITGANDAIFGGSQEMGASMSSVIGSKDRVTGDVQTTLMSTDTKTGKIISQTDYALRCRPTQRMF